jgi:dimethylaniline monooxygenase (N-oxide forming)
MAATVAVIGAGPVGLMALKNLRQEGFDAEIFEKRSYVGGLWKASQDSSISITDNTVFNSSRFVCAISDFPFPEHHDDFPTGPQLYEYLNLYADHFDLRPHIHLNTAVLSLRRVDRKWEVKTLTEGKEPQVSYFDKVLTATGSFVTPRYPKIADLEKFEGEKVHSINFPSPDKFKDQNVLVVGLHATAQDIVCELSKAAKKVWISKRTGVVMVSTVCLR